MDAISVDDPRGPIDYQETGVGPTLVLVPGSCSTGAAWRPIMAALGKPLVRDDEPARIWWDGRAPDHAGLLDRP